MHRVLPYWPKTGVVYDTNADYVCSSYPGETVANVDRLATRRKDSHMGYPLPFLWHEGSPRVAGYFPQCEKKNKTKNWHGYKYKTKISSSISIPKPNPTEKEGEMRKERRCQNKRKTHKEEEIETDRQILRQTKKHKM